MRAAVSYTHLDVYKRQEAYHELGQTAVFPIVDAPMTLDAAMRDAERLFSTAADRLFRVFKMGASARA